MSLKTYLLLAAVLTSSMAFSSRASAENTSAENASAADPQVAHIVFYTLNEDTPENRKALLSQIKKHLSGHEGVVHFSAGEIAADMNRPVNDREFHVSMNFVFADRKAHDTYNDHPRHETFKTKNKGLIKKVRVFDSYLKPMSQDKM